MQANAEGAAKPAGAAASHVLQEHNTNATSLASAGKPVLKEGSERKEGFSDFVPN